MKINSPIIIFLFFPLAVVAQSAIDSGTTVSDRKQIYHVNKIVNGIIIAGGLATDYPAIGRIKDKPNLSDVEINALNPHEIDAFDQIALRQNPANQAMFSKISDYSQIPIFMLPALLLCNKHIRKDWLDILFMYTEGHVITFTMYNYSFFGPTFMDRYRPITYYDQFTLSQRETGNNRNSFYSGHTASTAYASFFIAKVYCDYHPNSGGAKYLLYAAALVPPVFMAYCRVMALDHFPSDCMVGMAIGATMGVAIPEFHRKRFENVSFSVYSPPGALGVTCLLTVPTKKIM